MKSVTKALSFTLLAVVMTGSIVTAQTGGPVSGGTTTTAPVTSGITGGPISGTGSATTTGVTGTTSSTTTINGTTVQSNGVTATPVGSTATTPGSPVGGGVAPGGGTNSPGFSQLPGGNLLGPATGFPTGGGTFPSNTTTGISNTLLNGTGVQQTSTATVDTSATSSTNTSSSLFSPSSLITGIAIPAALSGFDVVGPLAANANFTVLSNASGQSIVLSPDGQLANLAPSVDASTLVPNVTGSAGSSAVNTSNLAAFGLGLDPSIVTGSNLAGMAAAVQNNGGVGFANTSVSAVRLVRNAQGNLVPADDVIGTVTTGGPNNLAAMALGADFSQAGNGNLAALAGIGDQNDILQTQMANALQNGLMQQGQAPLGSFASQEGVALQQMTQDEMLALQTQMGLQGQRFGLQQSQEQIASLGTSQGGFTAARVYTSNKKSKVKRMRKQSRGIYLK